MRFTRSAAWVVLLVAALLAVHAAVAEARPATVVRAARVLLRRGPGQDYQAFATVQNGDRVEVEQLEGHWALVHAASDTSGYMYADYLAYLDGTPVLAASPPPTSAAAAATPAAAAAVPVATAVGTPAQGQDPTAEVERLRRELDAARAAPAAAPSPGQDLVALRAEVRRLADTTDALRSRLDVLGNGNMAMPFATGEHWSTPTVVMIAVISLLLGWFVGGAFSRREERNKRTRIRF